MLSSQDSDSLKNIYESHDCLVLPSKSEPWGLVVNEAIEYGLSIIASKEVGCAIDLIKGNGEILLELNTSSVGSAINKVKLNQAVMSEKSIKISKQYTLAKQAKKFVSILNK